MANNELKRIADQSGGVAEELEEVDRREIEEIAGKYSTQTSAFLAAVAGGIIGGGVGIGLGGLGTGGLLIISGPAGMVLGAALAVLAWRGRGYQRLERATEKARLALNEIESRLAALPEDAPPAVREALWRNYSELLAEYHQIAVESISDRPVQIDRPLQPPINKQED